MCNEFYAKATPKPKMDKLRMEALERSVQQVTEKVEEIFPRPWEFYQDITFSKDNAAQFLIFSDDGTKVTLTGSSATTSVVLKPEEKPVHILAKEAFKEEGRKYWEVDMRGCGDWAVGVVELPQGKKLPEHTKGEHLGRDKSSWMLESIGGELEALHNDGLIRLKEQDVQILGVYLEIAKKGKCDLTFYDVSSLEVLYKYCLSTKKRLYPVFSLFHQADETPCLSLRHFGLNPEARNESDPILVHPRRSTGRPDAESIELASMLALSFEAESATLESSPTIEPVPESPRASETIPESPANSEVEFSSSTPTSLSASEPVPTTPTDSVRMSTSSTPTPALLTESESVPESPVDSGRESNSSTPTPELPCASEPVPESPVDSGRESNSSTPTPALLTASETVQASPAAACEPIPPSPVDSGNGSAGSTPASSPTFDKNQNWKRKFKGFFTRPSRK
ncbi:uncharacterized protein LOC134455065 [Engraulis encrasicolus]|uniref:uncharacterized protein LOC134455065 n=1 Tax=Engraulis encrasicolus TaxID=184585 RepID=UPI002FD5B0DE